MHTKNNQQITNHRFGDINYIDAIDGMNAQQKQQATPQLYSIRANSARLIYKTHIICAFVCTTTCPSCVRANKCYNICF